MLTDCWRKYNKVIVGTVVCTHLYGICVLCKSPGADFTNGLIKPGFGLKFKTLVLNSVKNVLSQRA